MPLGDSLAYSFFLDVVVIPDYLIERLTGDQSLLFEDGAEKVELAA